MKETGLGVEMGIDAEVDGGAVYSLGLKTFDCGWTLARRESH